MGGPTPLRQAEGVEDVRARAEAAARAGSAAAALAVVTAAAEDLERVDPLQAAVLLADASWYARMSHGAARSLELARSAAELADGAEGGVALVVGARLGDALQWNGHYAEAQREWLGAAAAKTAPTADLLCQRAAALLRAGELTRARETAYAATARAHEAGERSLLRDALTFQAISEIHLGLLPEAMASARDFEAAVGAAMSGDRLEALGLCAWVDALTGDERLAGPASRRPRPAPRSSGSRCPAGWLPVCSTSRSGDIRRQSTNSRRSWRAAPPSPRCCRCVRSWKRWSRLRQVGPARARERACG